WTHRPSSCSPTPISRATAAIGRPVSITRCAASRRYSGVYDARFFLLVPITDILPDRPANTQIPPGQCPESGVNLMVDGGAAAGEAAVLVSGGEEFAHAGGGHVGVGVGEHAVGGEEQACPAGGVAGEGAGDVGVEGAVSVELGGVVVGAGEGGRGDGDLDGRANVGQAGADRGGG